MRTIDDDHREFVLARWSELESVALLVVGSPEDARRLTTDALARLSSRWREVVEDGRPGEEARGLVLRAALAAAERDSPPAGASSVPSREAGDDDEGGHGDDLDGSVRALATAVPALRPMGRAGVAARVVWDAGPEEVARLLGRPAAEVVAATEAADATLGQVHRDARAAEGAEPAPWLLDHDLADAVGLLLGGLSDPPDPALLVADRAGGLRRRRLLVGGVAAAGLAGAGWWVSSGTAAGPRPDPGPSGVAADDPVWGTTRRWPARGRFAADPDVQALVMDQAPRGSRLLYADEVGDRVVVVASPADISGRDGVRVLLWSGARGSPLASLQQASLSRDSLSGVRDVVALVVPQDVGDALLVLGAPSLVAAHYAAVVTPSPAGGTVRSFTPMPLTAGIGVELVGRGLGPASYVSAGGYQGIPAGTPSVRPPILPNPSPDDFARSRRDMVAELTGVPSGLLSTRVVVDSAVASGVLDPDTTAEQQAGRVVVVHTRTPDDAVVRSVRVTTTGFGSRGAFDAEEAAVVVATEADGPVLTRLPTTTRSERFLAVAPRAARARLLSRSPSARPVTRWVPCTGSTAVLTVPDSRQESAYRLLLEDAAGRELYLGVPPLSSELV